MFLYYYIQVHSSGNYIPAVVSPPKHTSPPFSQHVLWRYCNPLGILSSMVEILLFNSVFYDRVTPVSVLTLKPLLGVIEVLPLKSPLGVIGMLPLKTPSISYNIHLYIRLVVTL